MTAPLHLFEATGIEIEYMLVDDGALAVLPGSDRLIRSVAGSYESEIERGAIAWSNELVLHVIELKTNGPTACLDEVVVPFQENVVAIDGMLAPLGGRLMPTAMHPLMDPTHETHLWPHDSSPIYEAYDRVFGCQGHGWSNLQSMHVSLPFSGDQELGRLHAAIRLVLPLLPALAASSPIVEGRVTGLLDNRMDFYWSNSRRVPSLTADVVPEPIWDRATYQREILERIYRDIAPHDPEGTLQHEFLNSRGAIVRFDSNRIEIRVIDVQECPWADLAIAAATVAVLRLLCEEVLSPIGLQQAIASAPLQALLRRTIVTADQASIEDPAYLEALGMPSTDPTSAGDAWRQLLRRARDSAVLADEPWIQPLEVMLREGPLARRIVTATGPTPGRERILEVYAELCACLRSGRMFHAG